MPTTGDEVRKAALRRYLVFRIKAVEFMDLNSLRESLKHADLSGRAVPLPSFPQSRPPQFVSNSLRTAVLSWFCVFIDKNGLDVINLWSEVFPQHAARVQLGWTRIEPAWEILREFRDRAGFHADTPTRFLKASYNVRAYWETLGAALEEFVSLFEFFLNAESQELPEIEAELDSLLDEVENHQVAKFQREHFKAYMMIPNTRSNSKEP